VIFYRAPSFLTGGGYPTAMHSTATIEKIGDEARKDWERYNFIPVPGDFSL
jgi:hypothetical protein